MGEGAGRKKTKRRCVQVWLVMKEGVEWAEPVQAWGSKEDAALHAQRLNAQNAEARRANPHDVLRSLEGFTVRQVPLVVRRLMEERQ